MDQESDRSLCARRLKQEKLAPSPEAPRSVAPSCDFDLTGLPPTQASWMHFLQMLLQMLRESRRSSPGSPRFGERMATPWLDVARYAIRLATNPTKRCVPGPYRDW
jgi:hypothetical protein